jgi:Zn-dependent membrane protease YugP
MFYDVTMILMIPAVILALIAQVRVKGAFDRYAKVPARSGLTGAEMARALLESEGVTNVAVERVNGSLTDHYDPRSLTLRLSDSTYNSSSVAALGVAAHEAGHVLQHRDEYAPLMLRNVAVPTVNFGSMLSWPIFVAGMVLSWRPLLYVGIALFSLTVIFALITLPVEFNASRRALAILENKGYLQPDEMEGAKKVLSAAAMTYVASAVSAILQLLRLLILSGAGRRRD